MPRVTVGTAAGAVEVHDLPEHLSYSQLTMLHPAYRYACARKWGYQYRLKLPYDMTPPLLVGRAFDSAANRYFSLRLQDNRDPLEAGANALELGVNTLEEMFRDLPGLLGASAQEEEAKLAEYTALLSAAFAAFLNAEGKAEPALIQDAHRFTMRLDKHHILPVVGYSDRIDRDGTLVDHKYSGSPRWSKEEDGKPLQWNEDWVSERRDQLLVYWLARAAEERRRGEPLDPPLNGRGRLVVTYHKLGLLKPQVRICELALSLADGGEELLDRLGTAGRIAQSNRYPARPGAACGFCSFVGRCREDEEARGLPFFELACGSEPPF